MNALISATQSILNALAFANVNRIDELHAHLDQMNVITDASSPAAQPGQDQSATQSSAFAHSMGYIQGAL
jgi:hypothetical protein